MSDAAQAFAQTSDHAWTKPAPSPAINAPHQLRPSQTLPMWQHMALAWTTARSEKVEAPEVQLRAGQAFWRAPNGEWQRTPQDDRLAPVHDLSDQHVTIQTKSAQLPAPWTSPLGLHLAAGALLMGLGLSWAELHHELLQDLPGLQAILAELPSSRRVGATLDLMRAGGLTIAAGAAMNAWQLSLERARLISAFIRSAGGDDAPLRTVLRTQPLHWLPAAALAFVTYGAASGQLWLLTLCCAAVTLSAGAQLVGTGRSPNT